MIALTLMYGIAVCTYVLMQKTKEEKAKNK